MSTTLDLLDPQAVTITTHNGCRYDGMLDNGAKFGVVRSKETLHCKLDGATEPVSHRQLVRLLLHELFEIDPDAEPLGIPDTAREIFNQVYVGAGTMTVSTSAYCRNRAYGQIMVDFGSSSCNKSFGFSVPKLLTDRRALRQALMLWGRSIVPSLQLQEDILNSHAKNRLQFEKNDMKRED